MLKSSKTIECIPTFVGVKDGEGNSLLHPQAILFLLANVLI
jgi:hypothetical protein